MRKFLVLLAAIFAFSALLLAQQTTPDVQTVEMPKTEVFGGYSYMHSNLNNLGLGTAGIHGESVQATRFIWGDLGATADVSYNSNTNVAQSGENLYRWTYMFGPTYALRTESSFVPFAHVLFGVDHERLSIPNFNHGINGDTYYKSLAAAIGAGVDVRISDHIAARLAQFDFIHANGGMTFRYTGGLVVKF
jgi:hypothetical protein